MKVFISKVCGFSLLLILSVITISHAEELTTVEKALQETFPDAVTIEKKILTLDSSQLEQLKNVSKIKINPVYDRAFEFYTIKKENNPVGFAFKDTVKGKWGPIQYLLTIDPSGKVKNVVILKYQERRGRAVAEKRFLRQFLGKSDEDPIRLKEDIQGITGATISSRGITDGIRKLLYIFEEFYKQ